MALNQLGNTVIGGNPDMAFSARMGYARERGNKGGSIACHLLEFLDPHVVNDGRKPEVKIPGDHCQIAMYNHEHKTP
jgi:hypothetical protein